MSPPLPAPLQGHVSPHPLPCAPRQNLESCPAPQHGTCMPTRTSARALSVRPEAGAASRSHAAQVLRAEGSAQLVSEAPPSEVQSAEPLRTAHLRASHSARGRVCARACVPPPTEHTPML